MTEPTLTPRGLMHALAAEVAREQQLDPAKIIGGHSRLPRVAQARAEVAARMHDRGLTPSQIGRVMKRRPGEVVRLIRMVQTSERKADYDHEQDRTKGSRTAGAA
jgi:hypothetical protein